MEPTHTTSVTLEWAFSQLLENPDILRRAQAYIDTLLGKERLFDELDVAELLYLCCIPPAKLFAVLNTDGGLPYVTAYEEDIIKSAAPRLEPDTFLSKWSPPRYLWRALSILILAGQVIVRSIKGKIH
ncbi:Uncharacterized protein Fot_09563 [Forsythia ovata]|uniref:Cytochrome P450 n=1 Tax=Forsythia ovata TaxID=205694 RepID=A0ABD1WGW7_9LAMI